MATDADRRIREEAVRQARIRQQEEAKRQQRDRIRQLCLEEDARRIHRAVIDGLRARDYPDPTSVALRPKDPASRVVGTGLFAAWHLGVDTHDWKETTVETNYYLLSDGNVILYLTQMAFEHRMAPVTRNIVLDGLRRLARTYDITLPPPATEADVASQLGRHDRQEKPSRWRRIFGA